MEHRGGLVASEWEALGDGGRHGKQIACAGKAGGRRAVAVRCSKGVSALQEGAQRVAFNGVMCCWGQGDAAMLMPGC